MSSASALHPPRPDGRVAPTQHLTAPDLLARIAAPAKSSLPLPRLLVVLAHPDDEVLAMGGRLERLRASQLLTVTDGVPQDGQDASDHGFSSLEAYREARRKELARALHSAGLPESVLYTGARESLPLPDQTAALHLPQLTDAFVQVLLAFAPEAVLTHPYEGGHPDHDACAFAVHTAVQLLARRAALPQQPLIVETPFYHAGPGGSMATGVFLDASNASVLYQRLSSQEQENKQQRLQCFPTQRQTLQQFGTEQESFRLSPGYDFTQAPHPGQLLYEQFPWGMTGDRFRSLTAQALKGFGLAPSATPSAWAMA